MGCPDPQVDCEAPTGCIRDRVKEGVRYPFGLRAGLNIHSMQGRTCACACGEGYRTDRQHQGHAGKDITDKYCGQVLPFGPILLRSMQVGQGSQGSTLPSIRSATSGIVQNTSTKTTHLVAHER